MIPLQPKLSLLVTPIHDCPQALRYDTPAAKTAIVDCIPPRDMGGQVHRFGIYWYEYGMSIYWYEYILDPKIIILVYCHPYQKT
jgi:hypothetical protein